MSPVSLGHLSPCKPSTLITFLLLEKVYSKVFGVIYLSSTRFLVINTGNRVSAFLKALINKYSRSKYQISKVHSLKF